MPVPMPTSLDATAAITATTERARVGLGGSWQAARQFVDALPLHLGIALVICALFVARQVASCYAFSCGIPGYDTAVGIARFVSRNFACAIPLVLLVTGAAAATTQSSRRARACALAIAVLLGAAVYAATFFGTHTAAVRDTEGGLRVTVLFTYFFRATFWGGLAAAVLFLVREDARNRRALHESRVAKLTLDGQLIEAQLQALQAQVEPHFLFNTLANIRMLYEAGAGEAKALLRDLVTYLRHALPRMRNAHSTLGRELAMTEAYLHILMLRMGDRLRVDIDVPESLRDADFPPMMLCTLVENAIKHGLSPRPAGGTMSIRAEHAGAALRVTVGDDGVGFRAGKGSGVGLANTRARLLALYGDAGRLTLEANPRGGVIATIEVPCSADWRHSVTT